MAIASTGWVVFDCRDPHELARFYLGVLGGDVDSANSNDNWVQVVTADGTQLGFQRVPDFVPPEWPSPEHSQQLHLDLRATDREEAERQVLALGARALDTDDEGGKRDFRVYADPAGHPFCFVYGQG
ncbi:MULTISPECIES: VOC family protein [Streptomyces]|uniref:VOC family protein n=1 Tax=Streptomyces lycii TaxID=2654337 RepID=A0ABQ7FDZ4_9ACTN|nr:MULTISPECIES: VOC family protein [Streptomyces]KAF4406505.1 VOC family protein [Streptomyces lycii]PGH50053.1 glyoxalase [Streptomyces sp. Ru87]